MQQLHMNDADITIVIPMYNSDKFIAETIQSVLNQTYKNFKLIIIDDKSDDKSFEIVSSFDDVSVPICILFIGTVLINTDIISLLIR